MPALTPSSLPDIQRALAEAGVDGWLLYDFRGLNPIAAGMIGLEGMTTRRAVAWVPRDGQPVALSHAIEQGPWRHWPSGWRNQHYSSWRELEQGVAAFVGGKTIAMEYSPGDAVPYLDRIPAGVLEMVRAAGATVVSSGELVSRFFAVWSKVHVEAHGRAAEKVGAIAREAFAEIATRVRSGKRVTEYEMMLWIRDRFRAAGLSTDHGPNVSAGANAANPHYEPSAEQSAEIRDGDIVLIDLWAREDDVVPYADQTWMASLGNPSPEARKIWEAIRDARDAAIALVRERAAAGEPVRGADVDDAARKVIVERGYGQYFIHRTGHSIDAKDLHGSGPHLDNLESREDRRLIPGVGFSIEPGIYIPGRIGMRTEVNAYMLPGKAVVTPGEYQRDLLVL